MPGNLDIVRERVGRLGRSADDFGGDYVALSGGDIGELAGEIEAGEGRRDPRVGGHDGPWPGFDR